MLGWLKMVTALYVTILMFAVPVAIWGLSPLVPMVRSRDWRGILDLILGAESSPHIRIPKDYQLAPELGYELVNLEVEPTQANPEVKAAQVILRIKNRDYFLRWGRNTDKQETKEQTDLKWGTATRFVLFQRNRVSDSVLKTEAGVCYIADESFVLNEERKSILDPGSYDATIIVRPRSGRQYASAIRVNVPTANTNPITLDYL